MSELKMIHMFKALVELKKEYYSLLDGNTNIYSLDRMMWEVYADLKSHSYEYDLILSDMNEYDFIEAIV